MLAQQSRELCVPHPWKPKARLDGPLEAELVGDCPAHGRVLELGEFKVPSIPNHSVIL